MKCIRIMAAAVFVTALGCEDPPATTPPATSAKPTTVASAAPSAKTSAAPPASAASSADAEKGKMVNCPNAVTGAKTEIKDTKDGVEITVTAATKDEAITKEIRERAKHALEAAKTDTSGVKHTGEGTGGGALGRCPVVLKNTVVEVADVEGGSKINVKPKDAKEADWLRRESKERNAEIAMPGALEAGQGKMANCPSAVEGAKTEVKETKDAVMVTITSKDPAGVKDIQARSKKLVEAAKLDPTDVQHAGDGKGGGGFGRCPVVVKDTTVEAKDIAAGSEFTVKPKKASDFDLLKKETKERLAKVDPDGKDTPAAPASGAPVAPPKKK